MDQKKGRAVLFHSPGLEMEIQEISIPEMEPGGILVKVLQANVCGSDLHIWQGDFNLKGFQGKLPTILGHEMVGRIVALGEGVDRDSSGEVLKIGDRVVFAYFKPCGRCRACLKGLPAACPNMISSPRSVNQWPFFVGGFADYYYLLPGQGVYKVYDELSNDLVCGANCALAEVIYGLERAQVYFQEQVVVQGVGGLGLYSIAVAKAMGAGKVIAIDALEDRLELAKEYGADGIINIKEFPAAKDRINEVKRLTDGWGADLAIGVNGIPDLLPEGLDMIGNGGRYLEIGNISLGRKTSLDPARLVLGNKSIYTVSLYHHSAIKKGLDFLKTTQLSFDKMVAVQFSLEEINQAFLKSASKEVTRASIIIGE